ncbi:hypothetical protein F2P81_005325 [Scophthalmus maximus]|uniref:Uncharacterized protein n=1 Tax=Scophthalmus maximus TaxID=52904 RepID=A0A6A4T6Y1_SCOMX|nr:hypothetical protein F2P81_005325 [Scophthalmus maximus]
MKRNSFGSGDASLPYSLNLGELVSETMGPPKRLLLNRKPTSLRSPQLGAPVLLDSPAVWRAGPPLTPDIIRRSGSRLVLRPHEPDYYNSWQLTFWGLVKIPPPFCLQIKRLLFTLCSIFFASVHPPQMPARIHTERRVMVDSGRPEWPLQRDNGLIHLRRLNKL